MNSLMSSGEPDVRASSAIAMLCLGAPHIVNECMLQMAEEDWTLIPLALGGGPHQALEIVKRIERKPHQDGLIALGMLGHIGAMNVLWAALKNEELAASAATGLFLITGAELFVAGDEAPAAVQEDEPVDDSDNEAAESADSDAEEPAEQPSTNLEMVTTDQKVWERWWRTNRERFDKNKRYRNGREYAPHGLVGMLIAGDTPHRLRQLAYEELVIRYNLDFPFDTEQLVDQQMASLREIDEWVRTYGDRFEPGVWYYAGQST